MSVKLRCPKCRAVTYRKSLETLLATVEKLWKPWQKYLTPKQRKMVKEKNRLDKLKQILEEEGEIAMFCPNCISKLSVELRRRHQIE